MSTRRTVWTGARLLVGAAAGTNPVSAPPTALAVEDGLIAYVGSDDQARGWAGAGVEVVDLGGRLVTPAFVDAHVHLVQTGQTMSGVDLGGARSRVEVLDRVAAYVRIHPGVRVVVGQGWDEGEWADQRRPERAELDRAGGGLPVYLARVDVHSAVVSSALLDQLPGIAGAAGYSAAGWMSQDAHHLCRAQVDRLFTDDERRASIRAALREAARQGIGTVHELGGLHLGPVEDLVRAREVGAEVGVDVVAYWGELYGEESVARARAVGAVGLAGDLCIDGAIGSRTAALRQPYADAQTSGVRYLSTAEVTEHVVGCSRAGLQAGFHCIGDDAVAAAVDGFRAAAEIVGSPAVRAARHRLEHVEMVAEADIATLADLGVVASMQPAFDAAWGGPGELYERRLGRARATGMNPLGALHRAGVPLAFGSDSPVTPLNAWTTVRAALRHGQPSQRLSFDAALDAATRGAHWAARDDRAGTLTSGSLASFAVWEDAPVGFGAPGEQLDALPRCVRTVSRGRTTFDVAAAG
jgi:hypothetical protein